MRRVRKKRKQNDLLTFLAGLAMLVSGLYWLTTRVSVSTSFFGGTLALGGMSFNSGMIVVPFIVCIVWLFIDPDSFFCKNMRRTQRPAYHCCNYHEYPFPYALNIPL